jgi:cyclic pyranopterin phosphate synthase
MAVDRFGRSIHYLRISLTDKCNLRCVYCMPEDMTFRPSAELMQDEEILTLFRLFTDLGFKKFRLTGGEPTVRANVVDLVREMSAVPGVDEISMTTNGVLLGELAEPLAKAGLKRVNISIDTLDAQRFKKITRWGSLDSVWTGIEAAEAAGLTPIKLNAVIVRSFNDGDDVVEMAGLTLDHEWQIRYIEMMPFGDVADFQTAGVVTEAELRATIESEFGPLELLDEGRLDGEARLFKIPGAKGNLGFISSVTAPFCAACNRARLTSDGKIRLCLLREKEVDLLTPLRQGASVEDLKAIIRGGVWEKPWGHGLSQNVIPLNRVMSEIGG